MDVSSLSKQSSFSSLAGMVKCTWLKLINVLLKLTSLAFTLLVPGCPSGLPYLHLVYRLHLIVMTLKQTTIKINNYITISNIYIPGEVWGTTELMGIKIKIKFPQLMWMEFEGTYTSLRINLFS